jgi:hypothetical protein
MSLNTTVDNIWNIGTLHKPGIWWFYISSNYLGVILCAILIGSVYHNPKKTSTDILIGGLCSGCLWMSLTCGTQCLLSVLHGYFYGGDLACQLEALAHVSAILVQFFCVSAIAIRSYLLVVHSYNMSKNMALIFVVIIWVICIVVTGLLSLVSPIYLMTAGTYCFFGFSSPAIRGWLVPGLLLALLVLGYCYIQIFRLTKQTSEAVASSSAVSRPLPIANITSTNKSLFSNRNNPVDKQMLYVNTELPNVTIDSPLTQRESKQNTNSSRYSPTGNNNLATSHDDLPIRVAKRSALFFLVLLLGWVFAAIATVYEFAFGLATEWLVTAVGVGGVLHSVWVPLTYAYTSDFHKKTMLYLFTCHCLVCSDRCSNMFHADDVDTRIETVATGPVNSDPPTNKSISVPPVIVVTPN